MANHMNITTKWKSSLVAAALLAAGFAGGWFLAPNAEPSPVQHAKAPTTQSDLSVGYDLLTRTLEDESNLGKLGLFKTITFDRPPEAIRELLTEVGDTASKTVEELDRYRKASPPVPRIPKQGGIGDRLQDAIKEQTKSALLERSPRFSTRLLLSQAQALGVLTALTSELAKIDPNEERREWLRRVSAQFGKMNDAYVQELHFEPSGG
jgi:hypothetical protein